jgi:hypothetical protein
MKSERLTTDSFYLPKLDIVSYFNKLKTTEDVEADLEEKWIQRA